MDSTSQTTDNGACRSAGHEPVAICGVALHLPGAAHDATLLPEQLSKSSSDGHGKNGPDMDASDGYTGHHTAEQKLLEVVYKALEDGGETQYRGAEARVGLFVSENACSTHQGNHNYIKDEEEEDRGVLSLAFEKYDLCGSR